VIDSPLGPLGAEAGAGGALTSLVFGRGGDGPEELRRQLSEYFAGERTEFDLRLAPAGTPWQRAVWDALLQVPYGETITYAELAARAGRPAAARAAGAANGRNPIAIVIPCHRVVGTSGALTGYGGGLGAKAWLLAHERRVRSRAPSPGSPRRRATARRARPAA
jgi:methylated-DNA-[protein]-cysteine S-methyltransferase